MEINTSVSKDWIKNSYKEFGRALNPVYTGPTPSSNWLISDKLLVGGYPEKDDDIKAIENAGINTFVCLNEEYGRNDLHRPFPKYAQSLSKNNQFIHFPMKDMAPHKNDAELMKFCNLLANQLVAGNKLYIHCTGGHGRTGVVAAIVLHILTGHDTDVLFDYVQYCHDQRVYHNFGHKFFGQQLPEDVKPKIVMGQVPSPQIAHQRYQVYRCVIQLLKDSM